ncbi:MAG: PAS domain-containing sensor histidine kinase, partial [Devosia sp.]
GRAGQDPAPARQAPMGLAGSGLLAGLSMPMRLVLLAGVAGLPFGVYGLSQGTPAGLLAAAFSLALGLAVPVALHVARRREGATAMRPAAGLGQADIRDLLEKLRDGVMRLGEDGGVRFASGSAATLLGCPRYGLLGQGLFERVHVLDRPAWLTALDTVRRTGAGRIVELRLRQDDAEGLTRAPRFILASAELSRSADGREVLVILEEIGIGMPAEGAARQGGEDGDALPHGAQLLATIGHELKTPLNAIVGFADMLGDGLAGQLNGTQKDYAGLIGKSGRHLVGVVDALLDYSRIEAGRFALEPQLFDPAAIVAPSLAMVGAMAQSQGVTLKTELPAALPAVMADERACRQILINLLTNAIKFSQKGATVSVSLRRQGRHLCLQVSDSGIGMDTDSLARLGEPFFQAQQGFDRRYGGTGLGLSIVKGLVGLHGGRMVAQSSPGEGTVMSVLLPINGPATKLEDTGQVVSLDRDPSNQPMPQPMSTWPDARRRAR